MNTPAHVPPELVVDFDIYNPSAEGHDFHRAWSEFQATAKGPLVWSNRYGGHWIATQGADVFALYRDHEGFSSDKNVVPVLPDPQPLLGALNLDPPRHTGFRRFLTAGLSARMVEAREQEIRGLAIKLIDTLAAKKGCEFIMEYADVLPLSVFLNLVALPLEDREMLATWTGWIVRGEDLASRAEGFQRLAVYLQPIILERRGRSEGDLLTQLANTKEGDELLTIEEAVGAAVHLMVAGLDTVASILGFVFHYLAQSPSLQQRLAGDPGRIPDLASEFLRRFPIVTMSRRVREDVTLHGVQLKADDMIALPSMLYNLDPSVYSEPMEIRTDRALKLVCTFGNGAHRCPGSILGRKELIITLEEWFRRVPSFRMAEGSEPPVFGGIVAVVGRLDLCW